MNNTFLFSDLCEIAALLLLVTLMIVSLVLSRRARQSSDGRGETLARQAAFAAAGADFGCVTFLTICLMVYPSKEPFWEALFFPVSMSYWLTTHGIIEIYRWRGADTPWILDLAHHASGIVPGAYVLITWIPVSLGAKLFCSGLMLISGLAIVGFLHQRDDTQAEAPVKSAH